MNICVHNKQAYIGQWRTVQFLALSVKGKIKCASVDLSYVDVVTQLASRHNFIFEIFVASWLVDRVAAKCLYNCILHNAFSDARLTV